MFKAIAHPPHEAPFVRFLEGARLWRDPATSTHVAELNSSLPHRTFFSHDGTNFYQLHMDEKKKAYRMEAPHISLTLDWRYGEKDGPNPKTYSATSALVTGAISGDLQKVAADRLRNGIFHFLPQLSDPRLGQIIDLLKDRGFFTEHAIRPLKTAREGIEVVDLIAANLPEGWHLLDLFEWMTFGPWEETTSLNQDLVESSRGYSQQAISFLDRIRNVGSGFTLIIKNIETLGVDKRSNLLELFAGVSFIPVWQAMARHYQHHGYWSRLAPHFETNYGEEIERWMDPTPLGKVAGWLGTDRATLETLTEEEYLALVEKSLAG